MSIFNSVGIAGGSGGGSLTYLGSFTLLAHSRTTQSGDIQTSPYFIVSITSGVLTIQSYASNSSYKTTVLTSDVPEGTVEDDLVVTMFGPRVVRESGSGYSYITKYYYDYDVFLKL